MTTQVKFSLRDTVKLAVELGIGPDPKDIATKVLEMIPIGSERDALAEMLPEFCRRVMIRPRQDRKLHFARAARATDGMMTGKWALVREEVLNDPFNVEGRWIPFGDLTHADVTWIIADRKQGADELSAEATRFTNLLSLMKRQKVATVRKLPFDMIEKVMS